MSSPTIKDAPEVKQQPTEHINLKVVAQVLIFASCFFSCR